MSEQGMPTEGVCKWRGLPWSYCGGECTDNVMLGSDDRSGSGVGPTGDAAADGMPSDHASAESNDALRRAPDNVAESTKG